MGLPSPAWRTTRDVTRLFAPRPLEVECLGPTSSMGPTLLGAYSSVQQNGSSLGGSGAITYERSSPTDERSLFET